MRAPSLRILAMAAAVAVGLVAAAPAGAATAQRCDRLRGTVKLNDGKIKVVERKVNDRRLKGRRLLATPRQGVHDRRARHAEEPGGRPQLGRLQARPARGPLPAGEALLRRRRRADPGENVCGGTEGVAFDATPPVEPGGGFAILYAHLASAHQPNEGETHHA